MLDVWKGSEYVFEEPNQNGHRALWLLIESGRLCEDGLINIFPFWLGTYSSGEVIWVGCLIEALRCKSKLKEI